VDKYFIIDSIHNLIHRNIHYALYKPYIKNIFVSQFFKPMWITLWLCGKLDKKILAETPYPP